MTRTRWAMFGVAMAMNGLGVLLTPMPYSLWFALGVVIGLVGLKVEAGLRS